MTAKEWDASWTMFHTVALAAQNARRGDTQETRSQQ
jgi:hypothetical protein